MSQSRRASWVHDVRRSVSQERRRMVLSGSVDSAVGRSGRQILGRPQIFRACVELTGYAADESVASI